MFAQSRACLKRRGLSTVLDTIGAAPDEPLLFLYPRWFSSPIRNFRTLRGRSSTSTCISAPRKPSPRASRPPRRLSLRSTSRRLLSTTNPDGTGEAAALTSRDEAPTGTATPENDPSKATEGVDGNVLTDAKHTTESHPPPLPAETEDFELDEGPPEPWDNTNTGFEVDSRSPSSPLFSRDAAALSADTRPTKPGRVRYRVLKGNWRLNSRDFLKSQLKRYRTKAFPTRLQVEWREVRKFMMELQRDSLTWTEATPQKKSWVPGEIMSKQLWVPEETVALLAGVCGDQGTRENIWYIHVRNGCKVHVRPADESEGRYRKVLLTGSKRVLELVGDRIKQARALQEVDAPMVDIRKPAVPVFPSVLPATRHGAALPIVRGVWDVHSATNRPAPIHMVTPSAEYLANVREFAEYVDDLTRSTPSDSEADGIMQGFTHRRKIAEGLLAVFSDPANTEYLSTAAMNQAFRWMCDHNYLKTINPILFLAQHVATVETANILLETTAKRQDPNRFLQVLRIMWKNEIRPNETTWVNMLDSVADPRERVRMLGWMLKQGFITQRTSKRHALKMTVQESFLAHLESGRSVDSFINTIIQTEDINWFSPVLVSQLFDTVFRRKDFDALQRLLEICRQQRFPINSSSIRKISLMCRSNIFSTIRFLFRCSEHRRSEGLEMILEPSAYERLFLTAFKGHHYNLCRVLWRYASMHEGVTWPMKRPVLESLLCNFTNKKRRVIDNIWHVSAGKVIVGVDLHLPKYLGQKQVQRMIPPEYDWNPVTFLASGFKPTGEERLQHLRFARFLIRRDINLGPSYRPELPMSLMLDAAAVMDLEWKNIPRPTIWLLQNAINIPVKARASWAL